MNLTSAEVSTEGLRREVRTIGERVAELTRQLSIVQLQTERAAALSGAERDVSARIDRLEHVLDFDRVGAHVREAVKRAELAADPVPHAVVPTLLPSDLYEAMIDALPPRIFFDGRSGSRELPLPPTLAPTDSIVTWTFFVSVVREVLASALVERVEESLDRHARTRADRLTLSGGRILLRLAGDVDRPARRGPSDGMTVILHLARPDDSEDYGSSLGAAGLSRVVPFRANSAVVFLESTGDHRYLPVPDTAPAEVARYTCELRIVRMVR